MHRMFGSCLTYHYGMLNTRTSRTLYPTVVCLCPRLTLLAETCNLRHARREGLRGGRNNPRNLLELRVYCS
jgi:hypothetical protein